MASQSELMQQYISNVSGLIEALEQQNLDLFMELIVTHKTFNMDLFNEPLPFENDPSSWQQWLHSALALNNKLISLVETYQGGLVKQLYSLKSHKQATQSYLLCQSTEPPRA